MQPLGHDHLGVEDNDDSHILGNSKFYLRLKTFVVLGKCSPVDELKEGNINDCFKDNASENDENGDDTENEDDNE